MRASNCYGNLRILSSVTAAVALQIAFSGQVALADVDAVGDVRPTDNPFTIGNEGIANEGNFVDIFLPQTADQPFYETDDDIEVGVYSYGTLLLSAESVLRYKNLVIGGSEDDIENVDSGAEAIGPASGVGIVRIEGFGTTYNSDPALIPTQFQAPGTGDPSDPPTLIFTDSTPRVNDGMGNDVYVGLTGAGQLYLNSGGRMEIQDALIVAYGENSTGKVVVDGVGSYLLSNGVLDGDRFDPDVEPDVGELPTIIGAYGQGIMAIVNGGLVDTYNGAAIGTTQADGDNQNTSSADNNYDRPGQGEVSLEGYGSRWNIYSSQEDDSGLAIGFFDETQVPVYPVDAGYGKLQIGLGATVSVTNVDENDNDADVVIGARGSLYLPGGELRLVDQLISDGVIRVTDQEIGSELFTNNETRIGTIRAGHFYNRASGRIYVGKNEELHISTFSDLVGNNDGGTIFMHNLGTIEVLGGELEFSRTSDSATVGSNAFQNRRTGLGSPVPNQVGKIIARDAVLRFESGFINEGELGFVGGDNLVSGATENAVDGLINLSNESDVTFEDAIVNDGTIVLNNDSDITFLGGYSGGGSLIDLNPAVISVVGQFSTSGAMDFVIGGGVSGNEFTRLAVTGDALFEAASTLAIDALFPYVPMAGDAFNLITVTGSLTDNGLTTVSLPSAPMGVSYVPDTDLADGIYTLRVVEDLSFGADFNGDGIVDATDLAVWRQFFGLSMGATGALGDADSDGDVDGRDLLLILEQLGGAPVAPAVISGATVPEPAGIALMAIALGAVYVGRRSTSRRRAA